MRKKVADALDNRPFAIPLSQPRPDPSGLVSESSQLAPEPTAGTGVSINAGDITLRRLRGPQPANAEDLSLLVGDEGHERAHDALDSGDH